MPLQLVLNLVEMPGPWPKLELEAPVHRDVPIESTINTNENKTNIIDLWLQKLTHRFGGKLIQLSPYNSLKYKSTVWVARTPYSQFSDGTWSQHYSCLLSVHHSTSDQGYWTRISVPLLPLIPHVTCPSFDRIVQAQRQEWARSRYYYMKPIRRNVRSVSSGTPHLASVQ